MNPIRLASIFTMSLFLAIATGSIACSTVQEEAKAPKENVLHQEDCESLGSPMPPTREGQPLIKRDPLPPLRVPLYQGEDFLNQAEFSLDNVQGRPLVINFWASWCPPCRREMPDLEKMWLRYQEDGVIFLGVDIWDTEEDARKMIERTGVTYPIGADEQGLTALSYGVQDLPITYFVNANHRVVHAISGEMSYGVIEAWTQDLLE